MTVLTLPDLAAVIWFLGAWIAYSMVIEKTAKGRRTLNALMNGYRDEWMAQLLVRDMRMVDAQVTAALQNGTAFFASTSLIAIGGGLALLRATNDALAVLRELPVDLTPSPALWEIKCVGLILIFIYAFFKFAWSYRLYNYVAIMIGAMPPSTEKDNPDAQRHALRTGKLCESAGRHFNRGQRAFFFALGYLGWFVSPWLLFATTAAIVVVMWNRQFTSDASAAMTAE